MLAETAEGERRVAAVPETVRRLTGAGWDVSVQRGAGRGSYVTDEAYVASGASIVENLADLVLCLIQSTSPRDRRLSGMTS